MHWSLNVPFIATIAVGCIIQPCNGQRKSNRRNVRVWNSHVIMAIHSCKIFGGSLLQLYCNLYAATSTFLLCLMYREPNTPHNINLYAQLLTANLQTGLDFMCILCIRNIFFQMEMVADSDAFQRSYLHIRRNTKVLDASQTGRMDRK